MFRIGALLFIVCTFIFFFIPMSYPDLPELKFLQHIDFAEKYQSRLPEELGERAFNGVLVNTESQGKSKSTLEMSGMRSIEVAQKKSATLPFQGIGYFEYAKAGNSVEFFSSFGEQLWKRELYSYPVADHYGKIVLLLTGDNNRVDLVDRNGNDLTLPSLSGNFLVDYQFATRASSAALLFAGGECYAINEKGELLQKIDLAERLSIKQFFAKSIGISSDGNYIAVHALVGGRDEIILMKKKSVDDPASAEVKITGRIELPSITTHIISLAVASDGEGVLALSDRYSIFYKRNGKQKWSKEHKSPLAVYRTLFADKNFIVYGENDKLFILDHKGSELASVDVFANTLLWRLLPGPRAGQFAVQSDRFMQFYRIGSL